MGKNGKNRVFGLRESRSQGSFLSEQSKIGLEFLPGQRLKEILVNGNTLTQSF